MMKISIIVSGPPSLFLPFLLACVVQGTGLPQPLAVLKKTFCLCFRSRSPHTGAYSVFRCCLADYTPLFGIVMHIISVWLVFTRPIGYPHGVMGSFNILSVSIQIYGCHG